MGERFVSERIEPVAGTADTRRMARGEPGLPREFRWRGETIEVEAVVRTWRETGPCRNGSPEVYVRKHWYEVVTRSGARMTIYFERQARGRKGLLSRWWLFTVEEAGVADS